MAKLFFSLPICVQGFLIKRRIRLPKSNLTYEVDFTKSPDDLNQAYKIVQTEYVARGFAKPNDSGLRITPFHDLPETLVMVGKLGTKVISTLTLIPDSHLGLPMDEQFDLSRVRARFTKIGEVSSLAVVKEFQGMSGDVLFPLLKFLYNEASPKAKVDAICVAAHPKATVFYSEILLFEKLDQKPIQNYHFANGAAAVGFSLDLRKARNLYKSAYKNAPDHRNLYKFFCK